MLSPLGFHNNNLLRFNFVKKERVNLWSSSLYGRFHFHRCEKYYPNTMNNSPCGGFQFEWIVLPEHVEFASPGFYCLTTNCHWILTKQNIFFTSVILRFIFSQKKKSKMWIILVFIAESEKNTFCLITSTHHWQHWRSSLLPVVWSQELQLLQPSLSNCLQGLNNFHNQYLMKTICDGFKSI